jgi:hypothetical protein
MDRFDGRVAVVTGAASGTLFSDIPLTTMGEDVNFWGVVHGCRTCSKFAVQALSECLDAELRAAGERTGVAVLMPGPVRTQKTLKETARAVSQRVRTTLLSTAGGPVCPPRCRTEASHRPPSPSTCWTRSERTSSSCCPMPPRPWPRSADGFAG